ncbi:N-acetylneuraminate synthase family protein, partial [bacterium]|nr:N-acetylneuraminate synthase family protein [bacterium]
MSARAIKNKPEIFHFGIHDDLLFFLDLANNHQGSLDHAKKVIKALADIKKRTSARIMIKLQFRNLDTFIHPGDMMMEVDNAEDLTKHSRRFRETALSKDQYKKMLSYAKSLNIPIYATPFDEASVDMCVDFDFDVIKVASCSAYDWPLLRKIASTGKPVIISLGGMKPNEIDDVVDYFTESGSPFALMHCVSTYPTDINDFRLDIIPWLKKRYPDVPVGYSGHEQPDEHDIGQMCIAKGATMLERHVGLATETITLNKYSVGPKEAEGWIIAAQRAA